MASLTLLDDILRNNTFYLSCILCSIFVCIYLWCSLATLVHGQALSRPLELLPNLLDKYDG